MCRNFSWRCRDGRTRDSRSSGARERTGKAERPPPALRWVAAFLACGGRLSSNPACRPYHRLVSAALAGCDPPSGRGPGSDLRPTPRTERASSHRCATAGPFGAGGFQPGCLAAPHSCTTLPRDGCPPSAPLAVAFGRSGAVTPKFPMAFGDSRPVGLSPPAVWFSTTPPPTPRNVASLPPYSKSLMTPRSWLHKALNNLSNYRRNWYSGVTKRATALGTAYVASLVNVNQSGCGPMVRMLIIARSGPYHHHTRHAPEVRFSTYDSHTTCPAGPDRE